MFNSIWNSFRRTPLWVQVWVALILMPVNFLALCFLNEPLGYWVAFLAVIGMLLNIPILLIDRGMSKLMSVPHVIIWTPLCVLVAWLLTSLFSGRHDLSLSYTIFLIALTADTWPAPAIQTLIDAANAEQFEIAAKAGTIADQLGPAVRSTFVNKQQITDEILETVFLDSKLNTEMGRAKFASLLRCLTNEDTLANMEALKKVNLPVNLIWAMQDPHQSWEGPGSILANTFKNVTVDKIEQAGHFLQIDAEKEYLKFLLG